MQNEDPRIKIFTLFFKGNHQCILHVSIHQSPSMVSHVHVFLNGPFRPTGYVFHGYDLLLLKSLFKQPKENCPYGIECTGSKKWLNSSLKKS